MRLASSAPPGRLALAIAVPLALLAAAYAALTVSSNLVWIGPIDRATFGWAFVVPLWLAIPGIAGLIWAPLPARERSIAALAVGVVVAAVMAVFLATSLDQIGCTPVTSWTEDLPPSIMVGVVFGLAQAAAGLASAAIAAQFAGAWRFVPTLLIGGVVLAIGSIVTGVVFAGMIPIGLSCAPPLN